MDVFKIHEQLIDDYRSFTSGSVQVRDRRIQEHVQEQLDQGIQWPYPWLSLNPSFKSGGSISELVASGLLHPECERIFRLKDAPSDPGHNTLTLHQHQRDAVEAAKSGKSYVLTTGTGSGKSLAYIVPIVDRVLRSKDTSEPSGVKAIVVYPMNALANSQMFELRKFLEFGYPEGESPVTFARYTGQESDDERRRILADPPDILLTNYVMLELVLTRPDERNHLIRAARGLEFLVLDELHTYRGRQGADVALLVRRLRNICESPSLQVVGTSATMASGGTAQQQKETVADVATRLFGAEVTSERVIGETLNRATSSGIPVGELADAARAAASGPVSRPFTELEANPLAMWVESTFGLTQEAGTDRLVRQTPTTVAAAAAQLADETGLAQDISAKAIRHTLMTGSQARDPQTGRPLFAFRLHQFLSKGDTVYVSIEPENTRHITSKYQLRVPGSPEKALLPLGFCRECGQEYLVVAKVTERGQTRFVPRTDADASGGDSVTGYIYVSSDLPWQVNPLEFSRLPDHWVVTTEAGETGIIPPRPSTCPTRSGSLRTAR